MISQADWHEFLYSCDFVGQQWGHVNKVGMAYIYWRTKVTVAPFKPSPWHNEVQKMLDVFLANPDAGEERLAQFLAEPHYGARGPNSLISGENKQRIIKMLHYIVTEKPNLEEWVN